MRHLVLDVVLPAARRHVRAALPGRPWLRKLSRDRRAAEDAEDVIAETVLRVLTRIQLLREGAAVMQIADLDAFVAVAARNAVASLHRQSHPGRTLVAKRLDYHLGGMPDIEIRQSRDGKESVVLVSGCSGSSDTAGDGGPTRARIREHLRAAGGTMSHDVLVRLVAGDGSMPMTAVLLTDLASNDAVPDLTDRDVGPDRDAVAHEELRVLWAEIVELPLHQRRALLLGLDDIALLPISGTASLKRIAEAMDMPSERLARLWRDLPMSDAQIAVEIGTTEVRVRSFRKCARERLGRRMAAAGLGPIVGTQGGRK